MAKHKLEDVITHVESEGWKLLADEYHTQEEQMKFICPEGHEAYMSYKKWKRGPKCPVCESNPVIAKGINPTTKKNGHRILALDQATNVSGWAIFDNKELVAYGKFETSGTSSPEKINQFKHWLASMVSNWNPDMVVYEDIQLQTFGGGKNQPFNKANGEGITTYKILAHLQGVLEDLCFENKVKAELIHVSSWRSFCEIKGRSRNDKKRSAQLKVKDWYDVTATQDEADAICIGKYGAEKVYKNSRMIEW